MKLNKKGNRIRASDKSLFFRFSAGSLLLLLFAVVILLNLKSILSTDWKSVSFLQGGSVHFTITPYMIVTVIVAALVCVIAAFLYRRFQYDRVKQLFHRQKLAHMILENGWFTIIEALLRCNAVMYVLDPKNADLADLFVVMPEVYYKKDDIIACIDRFYDGMMARSDVMKLMENYKTGENYAYLGLAPYFLIFDEYVAFMEMLMTKESAAVLNKLKQIVMLGRQAGYFLILACQRQTQNI